MANRKFLKKAIDYLCDDLRLEVLCSTIQSDTDEAKFEELLSRVDSLNAKYKSCKHPSVGNTDKKSVKQYYKRLQEDIDAEVDAIYAELKSLNKEKTEN